MRPAPHAVLALLPALGLLSPVTPAQLRATDAQIQECLQLARPALLQQLRHNRGDVLALLCLAAQHDKIPPDDKLFARALKRLERSVLRGTYGASIRLMVCAGRPSPYPFETLQKLRDRDLKTILKNRFGPGFSYQDRRGFWDLSNTQYAFLGLRAAVSLGAKVDPEVFRTTVAAVLDLQHENGGFGYTKNTRRKTPYSAMTVAGIAVLAIAQQNLPAAECQQLGIPEALKQAWHWQALHKTDIGITTTLSCLYFHYGLERAAILCDVDKVGDWDWYRRGAAMIRDMQDRKDGGWSSSYEIRPGALPGPGSPVDTAFAVLFLRRAFRRELPLHPAVRAPTTPRLGPQATAEDIAASARTWAQQGRASLPKVMRFLRHPSRNRRKAAVLALTEISGQDFGIDPERPPTESGPGIKQAERWWLRTRRGSDTRR